LNFFQRLKFLLSNKAYENHIQNFLSGADLTTGGVTQETALKYSAFFGCNRVLAETFASVPINEYKKVDSDNREATNDTGVLPILKFNPNDETSRYNFQECQMYQINLGGNFVAQRLQDGRRLVGLSQIEWQLCQIYRDKNDGKIKYKVKGENGQETIFERKDVLHVPGPSVNGIIGMSVLEYAGSAIRLGDTYEAFSQKFYDNGALTSGVFEIPKFLKDEAYNRLKADLKNNYRGLKNAGTPMLLEDGLTFKPVSIKLVDAELLGSQKFKIEDICRYFRVQPHLIQHLERSTNNNIEQQSLEFVMYTMLPHFRRFEDNINSQLLTTKQRSNGYYFEYNLASLLRGDQKSMAESFATGIQWGWLSVNDVRRMLNLNSVAGGDTHLQPLNMAPLGTTPDTSAKANQQVIEDMKRLIDRAAEGGNI